LTRKRVKEGALLEVLRLIREEEPPRPSTRLSTTAELPTIAANRGLDSQKLSGVVRGELDWIVMKALEKDRSRRYDTANGLAMDMQRYLADEPVLACPPSAGYRLRKLARRYRAAVLVVATVAVLLVVGAVVSTTLAIWATRAERLAGDRLLSEQAERGRAVEASERAQEAERKGKHRLFEARLAQARADRWSGRPGRRFDGLKAAAEAADLARELGLDESRRLELRNEAIACMALVDLNLSCKYKGHPPGASISGIAFDAAMERYARVDGRSITVRRFADDQVLSRISDIGAPAEPAPDWRRGLAFSPDGRLLAAGGDFNLPMPVQVWDLKSGKCLLTGAPTTFYALQFSPDSRMLAAGGGGGIILYDVPAGKERNRVSGGRTTPWWNLSFSPDSDVLAAPLADQSYALHDVRTGKELKRISLGRPLYQPRFHPRGDRIALCSDSQVHVLDLSGRPVFPPLQHEGTVGFDYWSDDGQLLATATSSPHQVVIWDATTGKQQAVCKGHQGWAAHFAFSPRGDLLASYSPADLTRLWDTRTGRELLSIDGPVSGFSRDGRWLGFGLEGSWVGRWEVAGGREHRTLSGHPAGAEIAGMDSSPDGLLLASAAADGVRLWDVAAGKVVATLPPGNAYSAVFDPQGRFLITCGEAGAYRWPLRRRKAPPDNRLRLGPAETIRFPEDGRSPRVSLGGDGRTLAGTGFGHGGRVAILDLENPTRGPRTLDLVSRLAVSADAKWVATTTSDAREAKLWDAATGSLVRSFPGVRTAGVAFSPDNRWLGFADAHEYTFYRVGSWEPGPRILRDHAGSPYQLPPLAFSHDGRMAAIAYTRQLTRLIELESGRELATLSPPVPEALTSLCFLSDGSRLMAGTANGTIQSWDLRRIRQQLRDMRLDWDPRGEPTAPPDSAMPLSVEVDAAQCARLVKLGQDVVKRNQDFQEGQAHAQAGRWREAIDAYSRALELDATFGGATHGRARAYAELGQLDKAVPDYSRVIELEPQNAWYWNGRGVTYFRLGQWDKALADFAKALELAPNDPLVQSNLAWVLATRPEERLRDPARAVELAEKAAKSAPEVGTVWTTLGVARYRHGDWKGAAKALQEALKHCQGAAALDRGVGRPLLFLAMARQRLGEGQEARQTYDRAREWLAANRKVLEAVPGQAAELERFRAEAAALLGVPPPPVKAK
jgi:WD40 repeat protein/Flp pilus assembly protein TadD